MTFAAVLTSLRPRQWVKNLLVAAAPIAASTLDNGPTALRTLAAAVVFVGAAGATYLVNDAADVALDREHPTKRLRPIAAGQLSITTARMIAAGLAAGAVATALLLGWEFGLLVGVYLAINAWYSAGMKNIPGVELGAIASGFVLRAVGGGAATNTPLSLWFVLVVIAGSLFVVAGKRSAELARTGGVGGRRVLARYSSQMLLIVRAVSAAVAVVAYSVWVFAQDIATGWLAAVSLLPFAGALARYSAVIEAGRGEDPEDVFLSDRIFQVLAAAWVIVYGAAVYA